MRIALAFLLAAVSFRCGQAMPTNPPPAVVTTSRDLAKAIIDDEDLSTRFRIDARCTRIVENTLYIDDATGAMIVNREGARLQPNGEICAGDRLLLTGHADVMDRRLRARCTQIDVIGHGDPPAPRHVTGPEFVSGRFDYRIVSLRGKVNDTIVDEVDPDTKFLFLLCDGERILVPTNHDREDSLIGATVKVSGICTPAPLISRRQIGRMLERAESDTLDILQHPNVSPFDAPLLEGFRRLQPEAISRLTHRKAVGRVLTLWNGSRALVKTCSGTKVKVTFTGTALPPVGATVEAVGLPETDLYGVNLSHAIWRTADPLPVDDEESPVSLSVHDIVKNINGRTVFDSLLDGRTVRLSGIVRQQPSAHGLNPRLYLDCDSRLVPVDITAAPQAANEISPDSVVEVTGICLLATEAWQPNLAFSRVTGFSIAIRRTDDIRILAQPPFWTSGRLLALVGVLVLVLLVIAVWNRSLGRLAARRGHQLFREKVAHHEASLRIDERTRLAVELHDSLSQNLSGASMQIDSVADFIDTDRNRALRCLDMASKTLASCRNELRNCIWDLRSRALEESDMNEAIRKIVQPHTGAAKLAIRFNVPRARLSDNTLHALMRIIRELASNAVRHGHADTVTIAGAIEDGRLLFSIADNGCGFDPDHCPGIADGHFGLQGIRERIQQFRGEMKIRSETGKGTKVTIWIRSRC